LIASGPGLRGRGPAQAKPDATLGSALAGSIIASHVLAGGLPEDAGFRLAFLVGASTSQP
jgi:hypothetical protein